MKKVLVVLVLLVSVVISGFATLDIPQRELALGQTILADYYAFNVFPSLLPQEDSQVWMTFRDGVNVFENVAVFCKKSEMFNLFLVHDNFVTGVPTVNLLLSQVQFGTGPSVNFNYSQSYQSPLNMGYAISLGALGLGILLDYQYYNEKSKTYGATTNILDVNNSVFDIRPGLSLDLGKIKIDASVPMRLNSLKYVDTVDGPTTTNSVSVSVPFVNNIGLVARAQLSASDVWDFGAWVNVLATTLNGSYEDKTAGVRTTQSYWDAVTFNYSATLGLKCTPSEKMKIYCDISFGQNIANGGKSANYIDGALNGTVTTNNIVTTTTLIPTMNFGFEITLGKFKPRLGIINSYTQTKTLIPASKNESFLQPVGSQMITAGLGIELGDFTIDATLATGANTLVAALNNPLMIPSTILGGTAPAVTTVFSTVEVNYRF